MPRFFDGLFPMRRFRFLAAVCTAIELLFGSLSPAIAALQTGSASATIMTMEICQAQGEKVAALTIDLRSTSESAPSNPLGMTHDCPLCIMTHAPVAINVSMATSVVPVGALTQAFPALFYVSPKSLFVWTSQPARAPPPQI